MFGNPKRGFLLVVSAIVCNAVASINLCVAENGGYGETPPPIGSVTLLNTTSGEKTLVAGDLEDPVWIVSDGTAAFVGLFHAGNIVRVDLEDGTTTTVATGLSCPEGVGLDDAGSIWVVENPVGNECLGMNLTDAAHLTRVDLNTGVVTRTVELLGPHGLAVNDGAAFVCEWGAHALTKINLASLDKTEITSLYSPSGCAVADGYAFAVEQGSTRGTLVRIDLSSGDKATLVGSLAGPMGVAVAGDFVYVGERSKNRVQRLPVSGGEPELFAEDLNSPIGLAAC